MQNCTRIARFYRAKFRICNQFQVWSCRKTSALWRGYVTRKNKTDRGQSLLLCSLLGGPFRKFRKQPHMSCVCVCVVYGRRRRNETRFRAAALASFRFLPGALEKSGTQLMGPLEGKGFVKKKRSNGPSNRRWLGESNQGRICWTGGEEDLGRPRQNRTFFVSTSSEDNTESILYTKRMRQYWLR